MLIFVIKDLKDDSIVFNMHDPVIFFHRLNFGSFSSGCGVVSSIKSNLFLDSNAISIMSANSSKLFSFN